MGQAQGAGGDDGGSGEAVGRAERGDAQTGLGQAGSAEGDGAREDEVTVAAQRQGIVSRGNRPAERERAGVAAEEGVRAEGHRAAEGVGAGDVAEDARGGRSARTSNREGLAADNITGNLDRRAGGDDRRAGGGTEAGVAAETDRTFEDLGHAGVVGRAGESQDARAVLVKGQRTEITVVDRAREGGIREGIGRDDRAAREEARVADRAARAGQRADGGVADAEDVEGAAVDGQGAVEAGVAAEGVDVAHAQRAAVDRGAASVEVGAGEELDARAGFHESEVAGDLPGVVPVAGQDAAIVRRDVDRQGRDRDGGIRDGGRLGRDAGERADGLTVAAEVEQGRADGTDVHNRAGREGVVRAEGDDGVLIVEVVVVGRRAGAVREAHITRARGDHLAGGGGDGPSDVERRTVGGEQAAREGGVLDEDRTGKRADAGGGGEEDRALADDAGGVLDIDRVGDVDALVELELAGADQVDDVGARAQGARSFDAEDARCAADVDRAGEIVGGVIDDERARADLGQADVAGDLRSDGQVGRRVDVPLVEDKVQTVPRGDGATLDGDGVSPDSWRDEHAAGGDSQATRGVEGDGVYRVEAECVDRDWRATDGSQSTVVDVRASRVGGGVSRQLGGLARRGGRKAAASAGCGPSADDGARGGIVRVEHQGAARAVLSRQEIDA